MSHSTSSTPSPAATNRMVASRSWSPRMPAAPVIAPPIEPSPPIVAMEKISTDCTGWYDPTRAPCSTSTCSPPASPARKPEKTKPLSVTQRVDTETASAAFGLSRAASSRRPDRERRTPLASTTPSASTARQNHSMYRSSSRSSRAHSSGRVTLLGDEVGEHVGVEHVAVEHDGEGQRDHGEERAPDAQRGDAEQQRGQRAGGSGDREGHEQVDVPAAHEVAGDDRPRPRRARTGPG